MPIAHTLTLLGLLAGAPPETPELEPGPPDGLTVLPEDKRDPQWASDLVKNGRVLLDGADYGQAIIFFTEAYSHGAGAPALCGLGRAHVQKYEVDKNPATLRMAMVRYKDCLQSAPEGALKVEAAGAVNELRVALDDTDGEAEVTRLFVTSEAEGARASVAGGPAKSLPASFDVDPGVNSIQVEADGYYSSTQQLELVEGETARIAVPLDEREATLSVTGPDGAVLWVDGVQLGKLPAAQPGPLPPGSHLVAVAKNGKTLYAVELDLDRGEERALEVELHNTAQRNAGWALLGVGGAGLIAGGTLTGLALSQQARMLELDDERQTQSITLEQYEREFVPAERRRDGFRTAAAASLSVGTAAVLASVFVLVLDRHRIDATTDYRRERRALRLGYSPGGGGGQAVLSGRF